jgi:hypothetical protein
MKAMTHGRKCRMRVALITEEAEAVAAEAECAWEFREWVEVRTVGAGAAAETKTMPTANRCSRF